MLRRLDNTNTHTRTHTKLPQIIWHKSFNLKPRDQFR